ncbi:MAG: PD40 domain-containing protein [Gammaproteobacteria bacterium]|nr:PD40 domain-containing protein [Gammaproteobacteria bacterium]
MITEPNDLPRRAKGRRWLLACVLLLGLVACGGDGVTVAGGQSQDPVVVDVPIAYITRPAPMAAGMAAAADDVRQLLRVRPGAQLFLRERASPSAGERNLTAEIGAGEYDVRDLNVSFDGQRFIFALRGALLPGANDDDQPSWNLWEFDRSSDELRRIISSDTTAEAGHDLSPAYLPDGRIVFSSTRQRQSKAILLDEGKPQFDALNEERREPAFVLHVMNADGSDIKQISFNQSHDLHPEVMDNGQIVFSRWDRANGRNGIHLYRMNPDGTDLELLYGANSHQTGTEGATVQFLRPRLADGGLLTLLRPFVTTDGGADLLRIDVDGFVENEQPVPFQAGLLGGPAQSPATINDVRTNGDISPGGRYTSAWPLRDGSRRMFVTWSLCRLQGEGGRILPCTEERLADPGALPARPLYGLYLYDGSTDTQLPVQQPIEGVMYTEVVAAQMRPQPLVLFDQVDSGQADLLLADADSGLLAIRSVYDINGVDTSGTGIATVADPAMTTATERPARFLRVLKAVALPDDDVRDFRNTAFGRGGAGNGMREIIGYIPIEPDGSVIVQVPATVPLALEVLDGQGRRISARHRSWLQVRPGQTLACVGCHTPSSGLSHGRREAFESVYPGAQATGQPFPNTRPELFADVGETMAEVRARISCATDCAVRVPSVDVVFDDVWTDEVSAGRAPDESFAWRYVDLRTPTPVAGDCLLQWSPRCRAVIHYEQHIHPLWDLDRQVIDPEDGFTVLADNTCTLCHSPTDDLGGLRVPEANLDLTDGLSPLQADHFNAYRELVFPRNEREVLGGILADRLVEVGINEETGEPILATVSMTPPMAVGRALSAGRFFDRFDPDGSHAGWLSAAELRLLSEWMDIGTQYYNDPFAAPED